jgi:uncharacterized protein YqeY
MSNCREKIQSDLKDAMKARKQDTVTVLRGLMAAVKQFEVDTRTDADDEKIISIIQKEIKMRRDALQFAKDQNREDLISQNESEITLLQSYLGQQMSEEELTTVIKELIDSGITSIGPLMGALNKNHKGTFEGKVASDIAKRILT